MIKAKFKNFLNISSQACDIGAAQEKIFGKVFNQLVLAQVTAKKTSSAWSWCMVSRNLADDAI
jgi:hypothetical protein